MTGDVLKLVGFTDGNPACVALEAGSDTVSVTGSGIRLTLPADR
jgi:hypothetical protein